MTTIIKAIDINGRTVDVHDIYPTSKCIPNEKVVFKDIPFSVNDKEIIKFLNDQPGDHSKVRCDICSNQVIMITN